MRRSSSAVLWLIVAVACNGDPSGPDTSTAAETTADGATATGAATVDGTGTGEHPTPLCPVGGCEAGQVCAAGECVTPGGDCPDPGCPELCRDGGCASMTSECVDPGCPEGEVCLDDRCVPSCDPQDCGE